MGCKCKRKDGKNCSNSRWKDTDFCYMHKMAKECPVCKEYGLLYKLDCSHYIHLQCAENMVNSKCPCCRNIMSNLPEEIINKINKNDKNYKLEVEQEERKELIESLHSEEDNDTHIYEECISSFFAMTYLRLPSYLFPKEITIEIEGKCPCLDEGMFSSILSITVLHNASKCIENFEDDSDGEGDEDGEENIIQISRNIFINRL